MNINKISKIIGVLSISLFLTSCEIPFQRFLSDETSVTQEVKIEGMDTNKSTITLENVKLYKEKLNSIFFVIGNNEFYLKNFNNKEGFYEPIKSFFDSEYLESIKSGERKNLLGKVIDDIYYTENTKFKEVRIIGVGETLESKKVEIEVVSINDSTSFGIQYIEIFFNEDNLIYDVNIKSNLSSNQNTTKEISEDSLLMANNNEFNTVFQSFVLPLKNESIYNLSLNSEKQNDFNYELNVLLDSLDLKDKNNETLRTFFIAGKGKFDNYGIIGYMNYDKNAEPITEYKVRFLLDGEFIDFSISYNRLEKTIERISL